MKAYIRADICRALIKMFRFSFNVLLEKAHKKALTSRKNIFIPVCMYIWFNCTFNIWCNQLVVYIDLDLANNTIICHFDWQGLGEMETREDNNNNNKKTFFSYKVEHFNVTSLCIIAEATI